MIQKTMFDPPARKWHQPIARLLWLANCEAGNWPDPDKYAFYRLKHRLLQRHATEDGVDWQEITHHCYACDGTGTWGHWRRDGGGFCYKCNGTGVYRKFYIRLQKYRLAGRVFHLPGDRLGIRRTTAGVRPESVSATRQAEITLGSQEHPQTLASEMPRMRKDSLDAGHGRRTRTGNGLVQGMCG